MEKTRPPVAALLLLVTSSLVSGAGASMSDPWDQPNWVPSGGGISGPPFDSLPRNATKDCVRDTVAYVASLEDFPAWAQQMLRSSSDVRLGLEGAYPSQLGEFNGCKSFMPTSDYLDIVGEYCVVNVTLIGPSGSPLRVVGNSQVAENYLWTFCSTQSCSQEGLSSYLEDFLNRTLSPYPEAKATVPLIECKTWRRKQPMNAGEIAALIFLVAFGLLVISSSCYEAYMKRKRGDMSGTASRVFLAFSLVTNVPKLISVKAADKTMNFIFGMKFLSICWIMFGHTFYTTTLLTVTNRYYIDQLGEHWFKLLILNGSVSVDTFFLISGFLLALMFLRERENGVPFNLFLFYLHRILRLTPPYAVVIFFYATLFYRLGYGPHWDALVGSNAHTCQISWWTNILYVNNYVNAYLPCMDHSWYLAVDTQLYAVSPIVLFLMHKYRWFKLFIYPLLLVISVLTPFAITAVMKLPGAIFFSWRPEEITDVFLNIYTRAYARTGPYVVGIGLGFFLHKYKEKQFVLNKYIVALGWTLSTAFCLAVLFGVYGMMQKDHVYNVWESATYAGFHRTVWAIGVAWVIFACCHGYAGPVNTLLSWNVWAPFGRLTYCLYLVQYIIILFYAGNTRNPVYFTTDEIVRNFLGNLAIGVLASALLSLCFESPFITISKAFVRRETKTPKSVIPKEWKDSPQSIQNASPKSMGSTNLDATPSRVEFTVEESPNKDVEVIRCADDDESPLKHAYTNNAYEATP